MRGKDPHTDRMYNRTLASAYSVVRPMSTLTRILVWLLAASALLPARACEQPEQIDIAGRISAIIYSDLSKSEMLDQLSPYVKVGDDLESFHSKTKLKYFLCLGGGPGIADCKFENGLQLVADPDGKIQLIRRRERVIAGKAFKEMSISTHVLRWGEYARGYPE